MLCHIFAGLFVDDYSFRCIGECCPRKEGRKYVRNLFLLSVYNIDVTQELNLPVKQLTNLLRWCYTRRFAATILAQHSVAILLRHCFEWLQHCSTITTLCRAKSRCCESSHVASRLLIQDVGFCVIQAVGCRTLSLINQWCFLNNLHSVLFSQWGRLFGTWTSFVFHLYGKCGWFQSSYDQHV